jgi:hypothetical protein
MSSFKQWAQWAIGSLAPRSSGVGEKNVTHISISSGYRPHASHSRVLDHLFLGAFHLLGECAGLLAQGVVANACDGDCQHRIVNLVLHTPVVEGVGNDKTKIFQLMVLPWVGPNPLYIRPKGTHLSAVLFLLLIFQKLKYRFISELV